MCKNVYNFSQIIARERDPIAGFPASVMRLRLHLSLHIIARPSAAPLNIITHIKLILILIRHMIILFILEFKIASLSR